MSGIREHLGETMIWSQPRLFQHEYELHVGDRLVGSLRWGGAFRSIAIGELAGRQWTFRRSGFFCSQVTVCAADSTADSAVFRADWKGGGAAQFRGGRRYQWSRSGFWRSSNAFSSDTGEVLLTVSPRYRLMRFYARARVEPHAASGTDLDLLALLSGYLLVQAVDNGAVAAVVAMAVI